MRKITLITLLFWSVFSFSQDRITGDPITFTKHWIIKLGVNSVDDSNKWKPFDFLSDQSSSAFSNPIALGVEHRFSNANSISLFGSLNKWKANEGIIDGVLLTEDRSYSSVDLSYKFYFDHYFFNADWLDIYLEAGAGLFFLSESGPFTERKTKFSQNLGFGSIIWFTNSVGLNMQVINKFSREELYSGNQVQYFAGLTLKLMKKDFDDDGIKNKDDLCPAIFGLLEFSGCPDSDGDGVEDTKDSCPEIAGKKDLYGCPDADNDGVPDAEDECPDKAGMAYNKGCPIPKLITEDKPDIQANEEIPAKEGIQAKEDVPSQEVLKSLNDYAQTILFDYSKSLFKKETYEVLQAITNILKDYPESNFVIEGHTDNLGTHITNDRLSSARANAVRDYLISNGIDPDRLTAIGYGERRPKFSNATKGGRDQNRRVEVKLKK
jgi:outer membrane protein OmpA-like peptidoglycan-associated protein